MFYNKTFLKYFPNKLVLKKQGFAGFPNEMVTFLGSYKNYMIKDLFKISNFEKTIDEKNSKNKSLNLIKTY